MAEPMLIGIDVGTTSVKASLFDAKGSVIRSFSQTYPTYRPQQNHVEQNPDDWMNLVLAALTQLGQGLVSGQLVTVGLTSQVNTHVFVDESGNALLPAIVWQDGRCDAEARLIDSHIRDKDRIAWWGAPLPVDASHMLARMAWVARHHPDIWAKTAYVLAPKDYCLMHLTGAIVADPMTSFGVIDGTLSYINPLIELVPGAKQRMAPLSGFSSPIGPIKPGLPFAGTPMVTGTMDAWAGLFGCGAVENGDAMYLSGTSEILGIVSSKKLPTPGVIAFPDYHGITLHAGPTQSGGASLAWLSQLLGRSAQDLSHLVASADQSRTVPIFLPHLQGERAPLWDPSARGVFAGLDSSMGPAELTRSVMEGVAYSVRLLLASLEQSADTQVTELRAASGGMQSDVWCQIRADVLGKPIRRLKTVDAGVSGAALLAGVGIGLFASLKEAASSLIQTDRIFEPNRLNADRHDFRFQEYQQLYAQIKDFNGRFTRYSA